MHTLLAIDLGVKTGLALYSSEPRLIWYRSQNYGNKNRLKKDAGNVLRDIPNLKYLVVEGGGDLASIWKKEAVKLKIESIQIYAEDWRKDLFVSRDRRNGITSKQNAFSLAKQVITQMNGPGPTSLPDDAAEAVLIGYWGVKYVGWM